MRRLDCADYPRSCHVECCSHNCVHLGRSNAAVATFQLMFIVYVGFGIWNSYESHKMGYFHPAGFCDPAPLSKTKNKSPFFEENITE
jgi:hypothetical protein